MSTLFLGAATWLVAIIAMPHSAWHNELTKSLPAADAAMPQSPAAIRLWFAERVEPKFSSIALMKPDSFIFYRLRSSTIGDDQSWGNVFI